MNVERTIEFILQQQAKAEVRMGNIEKLLETGMRLVNRLSRRVNELAAAQKELAVAQKVTEAKLQTLISSLQRGGNGRPR